MFVTLLSSTSFDFSDLTSVINDFTTLIVITSIMTSVEIGFAIGNGIGK